MINYDCQNYLGDSDCHKCAVSGHIFDCPSFCEEYVNYCGEQPYKQKSPLEEISEQN